MSRSTHQRPEVLAPAGDAESLRAALGAGADAVYFGLDEGLNARARASNFPAADLPSTVDRVHRAGARAYLTLNTLVFEDELSLVESLVRVAANAGVDALIVQDPAVALLARAVAPTLELHASTQMTIGSAEAARFAAALGCTRLVVPRELSVGEIRAFAAATELELEVFVHGALCMSWSGQCLTSEAWGGRSANRGQCAQSCRLPYTLVVDGEPRDTGDVRYLLSPLDQSALRSVPALVDIGVASLKIEGRLKGPAYVATAVEAYRARVDAALVGAPADDAAAARRMALTYSRGFSDGFLQGVDHRTLVEGRFPKHRGLLLGVVEEVAGGRVRVRLAETRAGVLEAGAPDVAPGVGVGFDDGRPEDDEPGGAVWDARPAPGGWWLGFSRDNPTIAKVRPGMRAWVTSDPRVERDAERLVAAGEPEGRIAVTMRVSGALGEPLHVRLATDRAMVHAVSEAPLAPARGEGLGEALLRDKLAPEGGTPFRLEAIDVAGLASGAFVPVSALKALRRDLSPRLLAAHLAAFRHAVDPLDATPRVRAAAAAIHARRPWGAPERPVLVPLCRTDAQLDAVIAARLPEVELDWMELVGLGGAVERAKAAGLRVCVATVRVHKPGEEAYDRRVERLRPDAVLVRHWAGLVHFSSLPDATRPSIHGDFSLNVTNSVTAHQLLAYGADTVTLAHDCDEAQVHAVLDRFPAERAVVVAHHHIPTFHTEHCVYAHMLSDGKDFRTCGRPCEAHRVALADTDGRAHPVVVDVGCRNTVFEARAQSAASAVPRLARRGVRRFRVEFVWEDADQAATVLRAYGRLLAGEATPAEVVRAVAAHEQFGVTSGTLRTHGARP